MRRSLWTWLFLWAAGAAIVASTIAGCTRTGIRQPGAVPEDEQALSGPLSLETCADRLMPRLTAPDFRAGLPRDADPPYTPVESLGLEILYVLDAENSVRYLTRADLEELGITQQDLHDRAMDNLRKTFSGETVTSVLTERELVSLKALDSYDATRLLLLPEHLQPGEELVAVIPDRDTLTFARVPPDFDWRTVDELAQAPASDNTLLTQPVKVTHEGFEIK